MAARLLREGWVRRRGKGDHVNFSKPERPALITIDMSKKELDKNAYRRISKLAGWE
ncbi:MAG TPA: type II toxin-antitoxin system HicA family toxin [Candidatus Rubneribacter avistercoris]|nr:type II toxin-antitoxin system HicA family toxin [Candidatus Rubneribacter avistercoris]